MRSLLLPVLWLPRLLLPVLWLLSVSLVPSPVSAHDDPVVTVRVMCNGFNVLDMDAVLGEISDTASLSVDRPVQGGDQIQRWVQDQMDHDLRIEIVDMGSPQRLPDGYTLSWTARLSRQDWRQAGIAARQATNAVVIRNGRITEWRATMSDLTTATDSSAGAASPPAALPIDSNTNGFPMLFGIPVTLFAAAGLAIVFGVVMFSKLRR